MSVKWRATAEVVVERRTSGVRWLVLESDASSGGWFLFGHRTLEEASEFDSWHMTRDEALKEAEVQWGIRPAAWNVEAASE